MRGIRHISSPTASADMFATAIFENTVSIWSYKEKRKITEFDTVLDFGGRRLLFIPGETPFLIAGAYERHGICAYDALTGELLWQRKDLYKIQFLNAIRRSNKEIFVGAGFDARPFLFLDLVSGDTVTFFKGIRKMYSGKKSISIISTANKQIKYICTEDFSFKWAKKTDTFAFLDAAVGPESIVISQVAGPLHCIDVKGELLWNWQPKEGSHILSVAWFELEKIWLAIRWSYKKGGDKELIAIDNKGNQLWSNTIGTCAECEFFNSGSSLITSDGTIIDVLSMKPIWQFCKSQ